MRDPVCASAGAIGLLPDLPIDLVGFRIELAPVQNRVRHLEDPGPEDVAEPGIADRLLVHGGEHVCIGDHSEVVSALQLLDLREFLPLVALERAHGEREPGLVTEQPDRVWGSKRRSLLLCRRRYNSNYADVVVMPRCMGWWLVSRVSVGVGAA